MPYLFKSTFFVFASLFATLVFADQELDKIRDAVKNFDLVNKAQPPRILVYSKPSGFAHKSIPTGVKALRLLAEKTKAFRPEFTNKVEDFTSDNLKNFDGLIFSKIKCSIWWTLMGKLIEGLALLKIGLFVRTLSMYVMFVSLAF